VRWKLRKITVRCVNNIGISYIQMSEFFPDFMYNIIVCFLTEYICKNFARKSSGASMV